LAGLAGLSGIVADRKKGVKCRNGNCRTLSAQMTDKTLKVDRKKFEGIVKNLLESPPTKREDVKVSKKKPEKVIPAPPQK